MSKMWAKSPSANPKRTRLATEHFKVCPVCNALNPRRNKECFVCWWHGDFESDPTYVQLALYDLLDSCPELGQLVVPREERKLTWTSKLLGFLRRRRRVDISV